MTRWVSAEENEVEHGGLRRRLNARRCRTCLVNMCFSFVEGSLELGLLVVPPNHWARCEGCGHWENECECAKGRLQ